jgi:predicted nucleic acid-binding protein
MTASSSVARFVADSSIIAQVLVEDTNSARVETLLAGLVSQPPVAELWVLDFYQVECANVIWKRAKFLGLPQQEAVNALMRMQHLPLRVTQAGPLLQRGLEIGLTHNLAMYDSVVIALAERLSCELITDDIKQSVVAVKVGVGLKQITDFPRKEFEA